MNPDQKPWLFVKRESAWSLWGRLKDAARLPAPESVAWRLERRGPARERWV